MRALRPVFAVLRAPGTIALILSGALALGLCFRLDPAGARPGGGQNYRAPSRPPARTPYVPPPSYSHPVPVPVPIPVPSGRYDRPYQSDSSSGGSSVFTWLIILGILGLVLWLVFRRKTVQRAEIRADAAAQQRGIAALRQQDPGFDQAAFVERTKATMAKVNEAWIGGQMGPARRLISDGVYVRFQTQLGLLKADGLRNVMADWKVLSAEILAAEADATWDTVHVKVVGEARDKDVPLKLDEEAAKKAAHGAPLSQYQEVWSFVRRRGKHSKAGVPALEGHCPNCGADMPLGDVIKCQFCQALVNSGEHDWVLAEITQPEEWRVSAAEDEVSGLAELRARDPSVSRQELEDRGSVAFWKWVEARATGKRDKLARFCLVPPKDAVAAAELALQPAKLQQVAVGSAEVTEVQGDGADGRDHALVEVRWSASVDGREPQNMLHVFDLARSVGVLSKRGLSSLDCAVCGGQMAESDAVTCSYCGEQLFGGKHEWALAAVQPGEEDEEGE